VCEEIEYQYEFVPPNVLLVVDKSASMNDPMTIGGRRSKLQDAQDALSRMLRQSEGTIRFGWMAFPADDICEPGYVSVPCGADSVPDIQQAIDELAGSGGTPTGTSLEAANAHENLHDLSRSGYVVLITDGLPTCPAGNGRLVTEEDCQRALQAVEDLYAGSIETFVVGLGEALNDSNPDLLNEMAETGGRRRAETIKYYQANSLTQLELNLEDIVGITSRCNLRLLVVPEMSDWLMVFFDFVPVFRDGSHLNGWDYDPLRNMIVFYGLACDTMRGGSAGEVDVMWGCLPP
jgi:hypothetical protein